MIQLLIAHLDTILAFITGGGLVSVFTLKYTKKQAEASYLKSVQQIYQTTIEDLLADKELTKQDNKELRAEISALQKEVYQNSKDINALKGLKCTVTDCQLRKRD